MNWQGKVALVTGASSGIGEEFARQLHQRGCKVILVARRRDRLENISRGLNLERPDSAQVFECDLQSTALIELERFIEVNHVDILISNAGRGSFGRFEMLNREQECELVRLNLIAPLRLMHAVIPQMKKRCEGIIVSVSSITAFQPLPYMATYSATKAFNFVHGLALRYELREFGINLTTICPGPTETEFGGVARVPGEWSGIYRDPTVRVVAESINAIERNQAWLSPCIRSKMLSFLSRTIPVELSTRIARRALLGALRFIEGNR